MKTSILPATAFVIPVLLIHLVAGDRTIAADCSAPNFAAAGLFIAGNQPVAVAVGDLNGDGKLDLAVANKFSADFSVLLGQGDGTFVTFTNYSIGAAPSAVAIGDFNGDNKLDVAVADSGSTNVWVLLGNGNGTFQAPSNYAVGDAPQAVGVRDLNGDGKLDLAVVNRASADISVLLGRGNGTFLDATNYPADADPVAIAIGDFNGDNKLDLAVANSALFSDPPSLSILLGNGNGTFKNATNYSAGTSPRSVIAGDFNGDGKLDLAVASYGTFMTNSTSVLTNSAVVVLLGKGDGTFPNATNYAAGQGPVSVASGDFNGDGRLDLAVANDRSANVSVLSGRTDGTFADPVSFSTAAGARAVAAGGFNADNRLDLVVVRDGGALVLLNTPSDTTPPQVNCPANITVNAPPGACTSNVTFNVTATDNCAVTNLVSVPASGFAFPVGVTTVTSTARDSNGNSNQCTFTVTVNDTQPPTITCPGDITVNTAPGVCTSNVTFNVTATDNCAVTNLLSMPPSGFAFPVGTTTVTNTAWDGSGNSRQCTFTVTVRDTQPPVIDCPGNMTVDAAPGVCTSNVTFHVTATDNCAVTNLVSVPASGSAFPLGTTTVTSTAQDSSGNSRQCTFTVTVNRTPMSITDQPADVTACNGGTATFTAAASGTLPITVQWQANSGSGFADIANATNTTLTVPANPTTVGSYQAVFRNACGTNTSASAALTLGSSLSCNIDGPDVLCPNAAMTTFSAPGFDAYQWSISGDGAIVGAPNHSSVVVSAGPSGALTLTVEVTDSTGCAGSCSKTAMIQDAQPPVIGCPANITVDAAPGACTSNVTFNVTVTDNCAAPEVVSVPASGFAFPVGVTTVTNTAQDSSGNRSQCTFTVTVRDTQPPVTGCPADITVSTAPGMCTSNVTFNVTATDNCAVTNLVSVPASGFAFPVGVTTVTNTATDRSGNRSQCTFTVTVNDTLPPVIQCPGNISVSAAPGACTSNVTFHVTATDNCALTNLVSLPASGFAFPVGVTTVTNLAEDNRGNRSQCTFTVTVNDTQPPVIICPANITVNAAPGACTSNVTFSVLATDNCAVTNLVSVPASGFDFPVGTTTVTNTAWDSSGNRSQCTFTVTVNDTQPPVITCPDDITVNAPPGACTSNVTFSVTATDNCAVTNLASVPASGFAFPVGTTTVTTTARDRSGNRSQCTFTVTVLDPQPPAITCPVSIMVNAAPGACTSNVTFTVTATDNCAVTDLTSVPASGAAFPVGTTTVTTTARDGSGNSSQCAFTVTVKDTQPPVITCPANITVNTAPGRCTREVTFQVSATDNCAVTNLVSLPPSGFDFPVGTTTVTNSARDSSGNSSQCTFTVTVHDNQSPAITCPGNITVNASPGACTSNVTFSVTATDNCAVTNLVSLPPSGFAFPVGTTTVTNTAWDRNGNSNFCLFTVTVNDTQPPLITCPGNITVNAAPGACTSNVTFNVTATDNCAVANVVSGPSSGFAFPVGTTIVTSTARDSSGNRSQCTFTVTVNDTEAPAVSCPGNITVSAAPGTCTSNVTFNVMATDNCAVTELMSVPPSSFAFPVGTTTVTNTVHDSSGNRSQCTFTVTVLDNQPPVLIGLPSATLSVQCATNVPAAPTVTARDNCDANLTVTFSSNESGDSCNRVIRRTWSATDPSGNPVSFTQTITVHDDTKPTLTKGTIASSYQSVAEAEAAALEATGVSDNCSAVTKTVSTVGECSAVITVTGTDACGNHDSVSYSTCISAEVRLTIVRSNNIVIISWPFPSTGFALESTTGLSPPDWRTAPEMATSSNGRWRVTVNLSNRERYFRLRRP